MFPVEKMCKVLQISRSGYYNWLKLGVSKRWLENQKILADIQQIFEDSNASYGAPRMKESLAKLGYIVSRAKITKLMRVNHLYVKRRRAFKVTTNSNHQYPLAPNILNQDFSVIRKNQVWVSDITYIETAEGWMYLTVIIDLFSRKVVGWSMSDNLTTEDTITKAWNMAIKSTTITKELIFHSDRGSQYASDNFRSIIRSYNGLIKQSMSRKGNCWDNAVAESFFKSLKVEWVYDFNYKSREQAQLSVFSWIETWYNKRRLHSFLGQKSIQEFEQEMNNIKIAA